MSYAARLAFCSKQFHSIAIISTYAGTLLINLLVN